MDNNRKNAEKFWDKSAGTYDLSEKRFELAHIRTVKNTQKYLDVNDIVLEYGCGTGKKAFELADNVKEIHAIDISAKMIDIAKKGAIERGIKNVDFTHTTIFDAEYQNGFFSVLLAFNILHVVDDNQKVIRRIHNLLKPGGLLISITPCLKEKMVFINKCQLSFYLLLIKIGLVPDMLTNFKFSEVEDLISNGNFRIIETEEVYHRVSSNFIVAKKI
jgi:2-polyprenyl-3-methyl-5-hydroxy-6-metoxy-1,4-benzoquinol methylase